MKENFLPYESAKQLKELGFDEVCIAGFQCQEPTLFVDIPAPNAKYQNSGGVTCAPLFSQVEYWLWSQHKISIEVECVSVVKTMFKVRIYQFVKGEPGLIEYLHFDSPIKAKNEGIVSAINYLFNQIKK